MLLYSLFTRPPLQYISNLNRAKEYKDLIIVCLSYLSQLPNLSLPSIQIIHSCNHLLIVNKPPGHHSQPKHDYIQNASSKCLLTNLRKSNHGGGSNHDFLLPMHRLDQPCSGIMIFAKTSKAGSRIGKAFRDKFVRKDYLCMVTGDINHLKLFSTPRKSRENDKAPPKYSLRGILDKYNLRTSRHRSLSVTYQVHDLKKKSILNSESKLYQLIWSNLQSHQNQHLLHIETNTGAKHQIRAMLSQLANCSVVGDLRYGSIDALEDKSLALHAWKVKMPSVKLGKLDLEHKEFVADIPDTWDKWFNITQESQLLQNISRR